MATVRPYNPIEIYRVASIIRRLIHQGTARYELQGLPTAYVFLCRAVHGGGDNPMQRTDAFHRAKRALPDVEAEAITAALYHRRLPHPDDLPDDEPENVPAQNAQQALSEAKRKQEPSAAMKQIKIYSAADLLNAEFPEPAWIVRGLLPEGLSILAGKSKVGKSWLALQLAQAVTAGRALFDEPVEPGAALYMALEDSPRRLRARMQLQDWTPSGQADFLTLGSFYDHIGDLREGGVEKLTDEIERRDYRLVIIDTLSRAIGGDQSDVREMTSWLAPLQEVAHSQHCALLLVDHHRKNTIFNPDAIADILGSVGKGAVADTILGLYRERGRAKTAKLAVIGRDLGERVLALHFDEERHKWISDGEAEEIGGGGPKGEILALLETEGALNGSEIAKRLGRDRGNIHRHLQNMVEDGQVERLEDGNGILYRLFVKADD